MFVLLLLHLSCANLVDGAISTIVAQDSISSSQILLVPYRSEIEQAASNHHLPPALIAAVIQEESRFAPFATRHEPRYMRSKRVRMAALRWARNMRGEPTAATELVGRAQSYGLMQVMGETAREQGFSARYLSELYVPENAIEHGATLLAKLLARYHNDTLAAISAYNQGSARKHRGMFLNARYVYRVSLAWRAYQHIFAEGHP